jgi:photosystem II stability/assembly factor-like uncharacterized protein
MRRRLLVLALAAAAAPLAASGAGVTAMLARVPASLPDCPPGHEATANSGFDGGPGCRSLYEVERPSELMAAQAAYAGARAGADGEARLRAVRQAQAMRRAAEARQARFGLAAFTDAAGAIVADSGNTWEDLGPSPIHVDDPQFSTSDLGWTTVTGRATAIAPDLTDASGNTVYLGTAAGGVWKTTDGGQQWQPMSDDVPSQAIGAVTVSRDNGWVYIGTGEPNTAADNYTGAGAFVSKDGGVTWSAITGVPADTVVGRIAVAADVVMIATSRGLYRSADAGATATRVALPTGSEADLGNWVSDVAIKPDDPDNVTAAVGWRSGGVEGAGLYRSTDAGATFTKLDAIGFGAASASADPIGRTTLAYPTNPEQNGDILWAVIQDPGRLRNEDNPLGVVQPGKTVSTTLNGVYMSRDNGATWEVKATAQNLAESPGTAMIVYPALDFLPGLQSWYNQYLVVDPTDQERVLLGLEEIFTNTTPATQPGPLSWRVVGRYWNACLAVAVTCDPIAPVYGGTTTHPDQHAAAFVPTDSGVRAYVGNDGGIYSHDAAAFPTGFPLNTPWTSLNDTLSVTQPYAATMGSDGTVYLGLQDNGTVKIKPDGRADMVFGGDGFETAVAPDDSDLAYSETQYGAMRRTTDGGVTWATIAPTTNGLECDPEIPETCSAPNVRPRFHTPFELDPTDAEHLVYASGSVWATEEASTVSSSTWVQVFDLITDDVPNGAGTALDVHGAATYVAFCGTTGATNTLSVGGSDCNALTPDGNVDPSVFAGGIATNVQAGCEAEKAGNDNECWHVVAGNGLPRRMIQGIEIDPDDPRTVYAAVSSYSRRFVYDTEQRLEGHVYKSTDAGENWVDISGDLPDAFAQDVLVQGGRLIVATDVGVFATASKTSTDWEPLGKGIPVAVPAYELNTNPQGTRLVLATHGRGVWALDLTGAAPVTPPGPTTPPAPKPPPAPLPSTGAPAWLAVAPLLAGAALLLRRRHRAARAA